MMDETSASITTRSMATTTTTSTTTTTHVESMSRQVESSDEILLTSDPEDVAKADLAEMELLDDMGLEEPIAPPPAASAQPVSEEEQFLSATFQNTQPSMRPSGQFGLELPTNELLEVPVPESLDLEMGNDIELEPITPSVTMEEALAGDRAALGQATGDDDWMQSMDAGTTVDMSAFETTTTTITTEETIESTVTEEASSESSGGGTSDSFEDAFAALKEEIESNPQGERLDDILKMEQLQDEVSKIEFTIPQHEHALARGMPLFDMPEGVNAQVAADLAKPRPQMEGITGADVSVESMRRIAEETASSRTSMTTTTVTTQTTQVRQSEATKVTAGVAGIDLSGSLLDEATKARLSQVLDEIISVSVRKAVREEMPRLMERIAKETGPSASA